MQYELPPWLKPADTAAEYSRGLAIGAQIQQHNNALDQEHQQNLMNLELKNRSLQQDTLLAQQKIELEKSMHQEQMALKKQQLQQVAAQVDIKTKAAAAKFAAMSLSARSIRV